MTEGTLGSALDRRTDLRGNDGTEIMEALRQMDYIAADPVCGGFTMLDAEKLNLSDRQRNIVRDMQTPQGMFCLQLSNQ